MTGLRATGRVPRVAVVPDSFKGSASALEVATAMARGVRDASGRTLPAGGGSLAALDRLDLTDLDPRACVASWRIACDVTNPLVDQLVPPLRAELQSGSPQAAHPGTGRTAAGRRAARARAR